MRAGWAALPLWLIQAQIVLAHDPMDRFRRGDIEGLLNDSLRTQWLVAILSAMVSAILAVWFRSLLNSAPAAPPPPPTEPTSWWKKALAVLAGGAAAAAVVWSSPVWAPGLAVAAGASAMGLGVGLGTYKGLTAKNLSASEIAGAFGWGLVQGVGTTGVLIAAMAAFPAAVTGIAVTGSAAGIYFMLQEHLGWKFFPWEKGSRPFWELSPRSQNASFGSLWGNLVGSGLTAAAAQAYVLPRLFPRGTLEPAQVAAAAEADAILARGMSKSKRPGTAAAAETGAPVDPITAESSKGRTPVIDPAVAHAYNQVPPEIANANRYHGKCAEAELISKVISAGRDPRGAKIGTARVRDPGNPGHATPIDPCPSCASVLRHFGCRWVGSHQIPQTGAVTPQNRGGSE